MARQLPQKAVIFVIVAVAATILLLAGVGYRNQETRKANERAAATLATDRATFAQIETDMAQTYQAIVAAAGKPDKEDFGKGCGRPNLKFEEGALSCSVQYHFMYYEPTDSGASDRLSKIRSSIKSDSLEIRSAFDFNEDLKPNSGNQTIRIGLATSSAQQCKLTLHYVKLYSNSDTTKGKYSSSYNFECSKNVDNEVYTQAS